MTTWSEFLNNYLAEQQETDCPKLTRCAIFGHDGVLWAKTNDFPEMKSEQLDALMKEFVQPGPLATLGLFLGEVKYFVIAGTDHEVIRGKKESSGVTIKKTIRAIVIGIYDHPMIASQCNKVVEGLGDHLILSES